MPLLASELKVLERLARAGPRSYQELLMDLESEVKSNKTVLQSLRKLSFLRLIRESRAENKSGSRGRPARIYRVTLRGLLVLLLLRKLDLNELAEIAEHNRELLPLIFGRWEFFKQNNVLDVAFWLLENAVAEEAYRTLSFLVLQLNLWEKAKKALGDMIYMPPTRIITFFKRFGIENINGSIKQVLQAVEQFDDAAEALELQDFQKRFYFPTLKVPESYLSFLQTCSRDAEIKNFIMEHLNKLEKTYFEALEKIRFLKGTL